MSDFWAAQRRTTETDEHGIEAGSFPEDHPYPQHCQRAEAAENHDPHKERQILSRPNGSRYYQWTGCPGWETTHVVEVREAGGRVIGTRELDLRDTLEYNGSTNDAVLTILYDHDATLATRPTDDEIYFGAALYRAGPEVCPYDSDRCHEHLYELAEKLEDAEEEK